MKKYDPEKLLVSIHIPKCGGTSFTEILAGIFGEQLHLHYPDADGKKMPDHISLQKGGCVHGHFFHHAYPISIKEYYPSCNQFISVIRDPLEIALSGWHFQLHHNYNRMDTLEMHLENMMKWKRFIYFDPLPIPIGDENVIEHLSEKFIWITTLELLMSQGNSLYNALGCNYNPVALPRLNSAPRIYKIDQAEWTIRFREHFKDAYRLYDSVTKMNINNQAG